ncbi:UDP-N-acetylglucosamine 4,6-dehydratase [Candidatus Planktophila dulcis]|uniref:UDP-N-acetylglucosamine 4,6-dehydratase (inverting) n=1 Tax=Candidatus Planktophila dulcis TaxID=1884914 RepID=UPI000BACE1A4|nr:UDP-N-acetylglucosamine 4,6-dehydratase (inverting) [Candidatus Planktophila dulcis]ASY20698.1 UDP-N-acetylglucosamine 4,6-dehydratase [Candidatus Planktophila dulcis]
MSQLDNSSVLITGGTGSLGRALIKYLMENSKVRRIAIYSRDELKQHNLRNEIGENERLRWFIGDIRDLERLKRALHGVDFVIHAAALKQVDTGEYNPMEFIKTNILGSQNVIDASIEAGVKKLVALSTDKASSPINLYGATKLTADKLFVAANNYSHSYGTTFSVVRYGNVMGSRGSVIPLWKSLADSGQPLPITDLRMTRFWISIEQAVRFVMESLEIMHGGELYVPRIPSMRIVDLASAVAPDAQLEEVGMRPGEKLHEEMISADDSRRTFLIGDRYVVTPVVAEWGYKSPKGTQMPEGVAYQSQTNDLWMSKEDIRNFLTEI